VTVPPVAFALFPDLKCTISSSARDGVRTGGTGTASSVRWAVEGDGDAGEVDTK
jgi:hypothetical protein